MQNILDGITQKPHEGVRIAAQRLAQVAENVSLAPRWRDIEPSAGVEISRPWAEQPIENWKVRLEEEARERVSAPKTPEEYSRLYYTMAREKVLSRLSSLPNKGPHSDARNIVKFWLERAISINYNMLDGRVVGSFVDFIISVTVIGFSGDEQVGGTTIGNSKSDWGGFFDFGKRNSPRKN